MRFKLLIFTALAAMGAISVAVFVLTSRGGEISNQDEETVTEFAQVRAYAGFHIDTQDWQGIGTTAVVDRVGPGTPAEVAGIRQDDVVRRAGDKSVVTGEDVYAEIEKKRPGESIEIEVDRYDFRRAAPGVPLPDPEKLTLKLELLEEPAPGTDYLWTPWTDVNYEDQVRMGLYLSEVTRPLAQHYGIGHPGGVLVHMPLPIWFDKGLAQGDVVRSFDGKNVTSLKQLQALIDRTAEDKSIAIGVRRGGQDLTFTLDALGPSVPDANHLPAQARVRLKAALERGDLHPHHVQLIASSFRRTDPTPGESTVRAGTIRKLSDTSITIELYETGTEWTLAVLPTTMVTGYGAPNGFADLNVGEFVQVFSRGDTAGTINSKSAPLF